MVTSRTALLSAIAAIGIAATFNIAYSASANAASPKRTFSTAQPGYKMFVAKPKGSNKLKSNGGASKARECTWTNENIAECSETVGDTIVITCIDKWGKSIGC